MREAKIKIEECVTEYKQVFTEEYILFKQFVIDNRKELRDEDYGSVEGDHIVERKLLEMPETFYAFLLKALTSEEFKWFKTKTGHRWFARKFNEFCLVKKI